MDCAYIYVIHILKIYFSPFPRVRDFFYWTLFFCYLERNYSMCAYWPFRISRSVIGSPEAGYMKHKGLISDKGFF